MKRIIAAFFNSLAGLAFGFRTEPALREEMFVLAVALPTSFFIAATWWQWLALIGVLLLLLMVELLNTAIEALSDHVTPQQHPNIKAVKDLGSAAVLMAMILAGATWILAVAERLLQAGLP